MQRSPLSDYSEMTTARYRPTWDLVLDPLVSCKLCLGEYPVEQMTTIAQCQCIFCTLVSRHQTIYIFPAPHSVMIYTLLNLIEVTKRVPEYYLQPILIFLQCLKQYVELLIQEGLETAISCPDAACPKRGHLQENEVCFQIECMVASEIMQRYKKLQFERDK
ncbi:hypothetical protein lerEdw1_007507 [Lerista edwardsae]|nr:hypothetical protein lerEdw1_007507 [Lerista edwardsae]